MTARSASSAGPRKPGRGSIDDDLVDGTVPASDAAAVARQNRIACNESSMDEIWAMVVDGMADRVKLSAFFAGARLLSIDDGTAKIGLPARAIEYAEHAIDDLAQIMRDVTGTARTLTLHAITDETPPPKEPRQPQMSEDELLDHPAVRRAKELFTDHGPRDVDAPDQQDAPS